MKITRSIRGARLENGCTEPFTRRISLGMRAGVAKQRAFSTQLGRNTGSRKLSLNVNVRTFATPPVQENVKYVLVMESGKAFY